jgi:hypothetical protein
MIKSTKPISSKELPMIMFGGSPAERQKIKVNLDCELLYI